MSILGHEEIFLDVPRYHTIKALGDVDVFYLNKDKFLEIIEGADLEELKKTVIPLDVEKIARSIINIKSITKFRLNSILNATNINLPHACIRESGMVA
eukprot:CAMPEP_0170558076 /NCGR_PEP_ID=MMETSP0211-20121228/32514_1 /TAXON_ID=311385 /ORGANISM="Pseudokeronopsis sp., Strain OXSARD2" /LENGTH=97 /DNA_ID=CAMNT_0010869661 /DNA_START=239 /DNA_END=532 /DNA_ORIENTATION=-